MKSSTTLQSTYHYTNAKAFMNIIDEVEFWVSHGSFLNDYAELTYIEEIIEEVIHNLYPRGNPSFYEQIIQHMNHLAEESFEPFILSFSMNKDSVTLWSEYSSFYGYSLEIDIEAMRKLIYSDQIAKSRVLEGEVIYSRQLQLELVEKALSQLNSNQDETSLDEVARSIYLYAPFFKKECFHSEEEYRFVFLRPRAKEEQIPSYMSREVYFKKKDEVIIPYIKVNFKSICEHLPIKSITVGAKNNSELAVKGTAYYLKHKGYLDVPVLKSCITLR